MIKIEKIEVLDNFFVYFYFSDGSNKTVDFKPFIDKNNPLTSPLLNTNFFKQVKIYENGRGIYWPNEFDFCPDYLRYFTKAVA